jgi:hypothetical protein
MPKKARSFKCPVSLLLLSKTYSKLTHPPPISQNEVCIKVRRPCHFCN